MMLFLWSKTSWWSDDRLKNMRPSQYNNMTKNRRNAYTETYIKQLALSNCQPWQSEVTFTEKIKVPGNVSLSVVQVTPFKSWRLIFKKKFWFFPAEEH